MPQLDTMQHSVRLLMDRNARVNRPHYGSRVYELELMEWERDHEHQGFDRDGWNREQGFDVIHDDWDDRDTRPITVPFIPVTDAEIARWGADMVTTMRAHGLTIRPPQPLTAEEQAEFDREHSGLDHLASRQLRSDDDDLPF